jgi:hypothetical protein
VHVQADARGPSDRRPLTTPAKTLYFKGTRCRPHSGQAWSPARSYLHQMQRPAESRLLSRRSRPRRTSITSTNVSIANSAAFSTKPGQRGRSGSASHDLPGTGDSRGTTSIAPRTSTRTCSGSDEDPRRVTIDLSAGKGQPTRSSMTVIEAPALGGLRNAESRPGRANGSVSISRSDVYPSDLVPSVRSVRWFQSANTIVPCCGWYTQ